MKFLVTGAIRQKRGPALLISFVSVYILLYASAGFFHSINILPEDHFANLSGPVLVIEELHTELFFSAMIFLFTGSVIREIFGNKSLKIILALLFLTGIGYPLVYFFSWYYRPLLAVHSILYQGYLAFVIVLQIVILYRLNIPR